MKFFLSKVGALLILSMNPYVYASIGKVTVHNVTDQEIAVAPYHLTKKRPFNGTRYDKAVIVPSQDTAEVERPSLTLHSDSELFFVSIDKKNLLKKNLNDKEVAQLQHINIGRMKGFNAYIYPTEDGKMHGSTSLKNDLVEGAQTVVLLPFTVQKKVAALAVKPLQWAIKQKQPAILQNPHAKEQAVVRVGNELCEQERAYRLQRASKVRAALAVFLDNKDLGEGKHKMHEGVVSDFVIASDGAQSKPSAKVPVIALCCSGGGYRAMIGTAGYLAGLESIGLLDAATYMVGLSGSTWALNYWTSMGGSAHEMRDKLVEKMTKNIKELSNTEMRKLVDMLLVKWAYGQEITLVDLYGGLLANILFSEAGNARQRVHLSDQVQRIRHGDWIFPIYTAVSGKQEDARKWYEYTPYEIGGAWLGHYVPTWAYGRPFNRGISKNDAPEQSLGYLCGTFGSAFAVTLGRLVEEQSGSKLEWVFKELSNDLRKSYIPEIAITLLKSIVQRLFSVRVSSARVFNFTENFNSSRLCRLKKLSFVDAGLDFNLPYPPLSGERPERRADIIIFLDSSATVKGAPELRKAEGYAHKRGLLFPPITYDGIETRAVSIFKDEKNSAVPLVIYAPRINDARLTKAFIEDPLLHDLAKRTIDFDVNACVKKSFCNTFNFDYTLEQALQLSSLTEFNMRASVNVIKEAIAWKVAQKKG